MDEEKLKKCPFCGGDAMYDIVGNRHMYIVVTCATCGAKTKGVYIGTEEPSIPLKETVGGYKQMILWNRRSNLGKDENGRLKRFEI